MKKSFFSIILISLFILLLCLNAFAAPSPETAGLEAEIDSVTDANGNAVSAELKKADEKITDDAVNTDTIKFVMGDAYSEDMITADVQDVTVPEGTTFPITITFRIEGVTADTKGCFMHWTGSSWEKIDAIFGDGTMTGTFNSLSPVAFVMNVDVTQIKAGTSPQTSDSLTAIFAIIAVSMTASFVLSKKCKKI
jgi:hypothetical protein